jgi:UDP-N-acetylmuramoyl-tripeptide--D-alanyl-D-alanine ligase
MKPISAQQLADILGVTLAAGNGEVMISKGASTDTRKLAEGCVFFALRGENFNGDLFAEQALKNGASVVVVQDWHSICPADSAVILVPDTLRALQRLACWWRQQLNIPVVAITGSNGKTSTKDFTAAVLRQCFHVSATSGNLNNHIGLPLTVLATTLEHTAAVWEMGMNHAGEIAPLCEIGRPQYGIITNIGTAHIEFLGSREAIADEKGMLARALPADGVLCLPVGCDFHDYFRKRTRAPLISVGNGRGVVRAENTIFLADSTTFTLVIEGAESAEVSLQVPGRHMVQNALLAAAIGWKLGMSSHDIAKGLASACLTGGRLGCYESGGVSIIDDTYNANPESMAAAIETLALMPVVQNGRRFIVMGRMGELGHFAEEAHRRVGALAAERGLAVVAVGPGAELIAEGASHSLHFSDLAEAAAWLKHEVKLGEVVLFKGSRSATVERVMHAAFPSN